MADLQEWFYSMPFLTRNWFAASFAFPILCKFGLFHPSTVILHSGFISSLQIWRPLTAVLYYPLAGNRGFSFLMNLYFLYHYSMRLENGYFIDRPADYAFLLLFNWICLIGFGLALGIFLLMDPMIMSVLYVSCMLNPDQVVGFWFGSRFKARYLPWVLFGFNFVLNGGGLLDLVGILTGHMYFFVMLKYPQEQGVTLLETPQFMYRLLPQQVTQQRATNPAPGARPPPAAGTNFARAGPAAAAAAANSGPLPHDWGRGRRLD